MGYIDFHCHLDSNEFSDNRDLLVDDIFKSGVSKIITVADPYEKDSHRITMEVAKLNKNISIMTAAHPHNADLYSPEIEKKILDFCDNPGVIGVGEAGLDYYYNLSKPDNQINVFKRQISLAKELGLPLIIHSRNAEKDVLSSLEDLSFENPVVFHCYTGNMEDAMEIISRGYYISFSGIITFKKAEYLRDIVKITPSEQLFTETDSPYLSPEPFRGKVNNPSRVKYVADRVAEIKNININILNKTIDNNLIKLKT
ncbi:MAG: TatD family hydrolase [Acidobacteriota bacterium]